MLPRKKKKGWPLPIVGTGERIEKTIKQLCVCVCVWREQDKAAENVIASRIGRIGRRRGDKRGGGSGDGPFGRMLDFPIGPYVSNHPLFSLGLVTFPFPGWRSSSGRLSAGPLRGTASINTGTARAEFV